MKRPFAKPFTVNIILGLIRRQLVTLRNLPWLSALKKDPESKPVPTTGGVQDDALSFAKSWQTFSNPTLPHHPHTFLPDH